MTAHSFAAPPAPYTIDFAPQVDDLHRRLDAARWPEQDVVPDDVDYGEHGAFGLGAGPSLALMKELAQEWRGQDQKQLQDHLNSYKNYRVEIEGLDIHFLHYPSSRAGAFPLILCHGWPGGYHEFLHVLERLTEPKDQGSRAFHVVVPSMPGYAFSSPPKTAKWGMEDTARVFDKLMTGLGYVRYAAQGGDWGSITARCLGSLHKENCVAVHLNFCPVPPPFPLNMFNPRTLLDWMPRFVLPDERRAKLERGVAYIERGSAYYAMQNLTPRTPAYGLNDSPIGLLAWIGEKMIPGIDKAVKHPNATLNREALFTTLSIYWFTGSIGSSFLPYALNPHFGTFLVSPRHHLPNFALSNFPDELFTPEERDARRTGNLRWYKDAEDGGHFAALEKPEVFAEHVREAMGVLLSGQA
ncbi:epoxide hydrolase family protein [Rhodotorula paludigena]|uniref:epoxide hydrolase family protein n=1 Tax=Rhodotorula paludigena TaxID=86838 RepID=UPI0031736FBB